MQNPDVKNSKFGYAHTLVGREVQLRDPALGGGGGYDSNGEIIRVQEPVGLGVHTDTQTNIAVADGDCLNGERYCPIEEIAFLDD